MDHNVKTARVFELKKKFSWKEKLIRLLEVLLILGVVVGTGIWLLINSNFSFPNFVSSVFEKFKPEVNVATQSASISDEARLKNLIEPSQSLTVSSITRTPEGHFEVRSQENVLVIFSREKDLTDQARTLQTIQAKAKIENRNLKKVDFRFAKIVVEYN